MKHLHGLFKVSLILILALGFLRLEAHGVSAQDTNPPPAGETTDGSPSAPDGSGGAENTGGGSDGSSSSDSFSAGDEASGSTTAPDDEASNPADETPTDAGGSATSTDDSASTTEDTSTATGDDASAVSDDSPSTGEDTSAAAPDAAGPEDSSSPGAETDDGASEGGASDEGLSEEGLLEEGLSEEGASAEAAEIIEDAAEKDITLADGDGQPIVAADTQAQELLTSSSSDPWFVADDGTVVGYSSGSGCEGGVTECHSGVSNSIQAALTDGRSAGKTIHIEAGDYSAEEFTLSDDTRNFDLAGNISVNTIRLNTAYDFVAKVVGGVFSALNVWLNFDGLKTAALQDGVNLTQNGGTLTVASKTYNENVTVDAAKDGIHIAGDGDPTVSGGPTGFEVHADDVTISGFTLQNAGIGILADKDIKINVDNNRFYGNSMGVILDDGSSGIFSNNTFGDAGDPSKMNLIGLIASNSTSIPPSGYSVTSSGDKFANIGAGMLLNEGISAKISGDEFKGGFYGISASGGSLNVAGSTFQGSATGIDLWGGSLTSHGNLYTGNNTGLASSASTVNSDADTFQNNLEDGIMSSNTNLNVAGSSKFQGNGDGVHIEDGSTLTSQGNLFDGNTRGIYSSASTVNSDADTFQNNTEDGIQSSSSSLTVAGGKFQGNLEGIHLQDSSTLTSQGNLYDGNTRGIYSSASKVNSDADSFNNNYWKGGSAHGAYLENDSQAVFTNGTFDQNNIGIGLYGGNLTASNNRFINNGYGISITGNSQASTSNNVFGDAVDRSQMNRIGIQVDAGWIVPPSGVYTINSEGDKFFGRIDSFNPGYGALLLNAATGRFSNDIFDGNNNGLSANYSSIYAVNSTISNCEQGAQLFDSIAKFENDTFQNNIYNGIYGIVSNVDVTGSTFSGNSYSGAVVQGGGKLTSHGNTYTNNNKGILVIGNATATILDDDFEGNWSGISSENPAGTQINFSRFYNNGVAIQNTNGGADAVQADDNWWGDNQGAAGKILGNVDFSDWLALDMTASNDPIFTGGDTTQLSTQMVSTNGATNTPLSALDLAGIQGTWFNYTPSVTLQTPDMGTLNGDTFTTGEKVGQAHFTGTQFDDEIPDEQVTIISNRPVLVDPDVPSLPGGPGGAGAVTFIQPAVIPVTGAGLLDLACGGASQLTLPNGNSVLIPALEPCGMQASLQPAAQDALPGSLPEGVTFVDGLTVSLIDAGGNALEALPQESPLQVNFTAAQAQANTSLAVYWWDGSAWQEVPESGLGAAASNDTGLFVLVTM